MSSVRREKAKTGDEKVWSRHRRNIPEHRASAACSEVGNYDGRPNANVPFSVDE
jgi:hypothetical protein